MWRTWMCDGLAAVIALLVTGCGSEQISAPPFEQWLHAYVVERAAYPIGRNDYAVASFDLNDDGTSERIVQMRGGGWCGTGGCAMMVFVRTNGSWTKISHTVLTRPPVRILPSRRSGWHDIAVGTRGEPFPYHLAHRRLTWNGWRYSRSANERYSLSTTATGGVTIIPADLIP